MSRWSQDLLSGISLMIYIKQAFPNTFMLYSRCTVYLFHATLTPLYDPQLCTNVMKVQISR